LLDLVRKLVAIAIVAETIREAGSRERGRERERERDYPFATEKL
jgi:hypothetical protein